MRVKSFLIALVAMMLPMVSFADGEAILIDGLYYNLNTTDGTAEVTYNNHYLDGDVVIPDEVRYGGVTYLVTSIGPTTFDASHITSFTIGKNVRTIATIYYTHFPIVTCYAEEPPKISLWDSFIDILYVPYDSRDKYMNAWDAGSIRSIGDEYNLTYEVYLETGITKRETKKVKAGTVLDLTKPVREGCSFTGWYPYDNVTNQIDWFFDPPTKMPYEDLILYGYFEPKEYQLTYQVDGIEYKKFEVKYGGTIKPESEPMKEGYTFSGWSEIPETMPAHDVTVTGHFSINNYKLTYMVDGEEYKTYDVEFGSNIIPGESPEKKKGMTFSGWSTIPSTMPAKDVVIEGSFEWTKETVGNVIYQVADTITNCLIVIGNENISGEVTIQESMVLDGNIYYVTDIKEKAFYNRSNITSIVMPRTVKRIGERAFANIDRLNDVFIYSEVIPQTDRTAFESSYTEDYVTLHVPDNAVDRYKAAAPWKNFKDIVPVSDGPSGKNKCASPTIVFKDGKLIFGCETDGVEYNYRIKADISQEGKGNGISVTPSITVSVYASKDDYDDSDVATKTIQISTSNIVADANGDGVLNAADIVTITNMIMSSK